MFLFLTYILNVTVFLNIVIINDQYYLINDLYFYFLFSYVYKSVCLYLPVYLPTWSRCSTYCTTRSGVCMPVVSCYDPCICKVFNTTFNAKNISYRCFISTTFQDFMGKNSSCANIDFNINYHIKS